jgi:hypothetical protein
LIAKDLTGYASGPPEVHSPSPAGRFDDKTKMKETIIWAMLLGFIILPNQQQELIWGFI